MNDRTPEGRYREAWEYHIKELVHLALAAHVDHEDFQGVKTTLLGWVDKAVENTYGDTK